MSLVQQPRKDQSYRSKYSTEQGNSDKDIKRKSSWNFRSTVRDTPSEEFVVKPKYSSRQSHNAHPTTMTSSLNDNALVREMREKLKGRKLHHVVINDANIGRTYVSVFSKGHRSSIRIDEKKFLTIGMKLARSVLLVVTTI